MNIIAKMIKDTENMDVKVQVEMEKNIINKYKVIIYNDGSEHWYKLNTYILDRKNNPSYISIGGYEYYYENDSYFRQYGCESIGRNGKEYYK